MNIIEVDPNDPKLLSFAESIDHTVDRKLQTFVAEDNGEWIGYLQVIHQPSSMSGWKKSKKAVSAIKVMKNFCLSKGIGLTWCHKESPLHPFLHRMGFKETGFEVFFALPDNKNGGK